MSKNMMEALIEVPFKVDSITQAAAPAGSDGIWHSYVISQGTNTIVGVRAGSHSEVAALLNDMVEGLNARRMGKHRAKGR